MERKAATVRNVKKRLQGQFVYNIWLGHFLQQQTDALSEKYNVSSTQE